MVVGFTGVINTASEILPGLWQVGPLSEMTAPYKKAEPLKGKLSSLDQAIALTRQHPEWIRPLLLIPERN